MARIAHISDTHLGWESLGRLNRRGVNTRGADLVAAFRRVVAAVNETDPDLVVHTGDALDSPLPAVRYLDALRNLLRDLAAVRDDGTRRQVVLIAGNHDAARARHDVCVLDLFGDLPGVHVVTGAPRVIRFGQQADLDTGGRLPEALAGTTVTAVPHDALSWVHQVGIPGPDTDADVNILMAHGVAEDEGSFLYRRAVGREYPIPSDLYLRDWDYVALGHWHTQTPVAGLRHVWYAGSTEVVSLRDLRSGRIDQRGWLEVTVGDGPVRLRRHRHPVRPHVRIGPLDVSEARSADAITDRLVQAVRDTGGLRDAVVVVNPTGVTRDLWAFVDLDRVRREGSHAFHLEIRPRFLRPDSDGDGPQRADDGTGRLRSLHDLLDEALSQIDDTDRDRVGVLCRSLLAEALGGGAPNPTAPGAEPGDGESGDPGGPPDGGGDRGAADEDLDTEVVA